MGLQQLWVTPLYGGILGLLGAVLSISVIGIRRSGGIAFGDGGNKLLQRRIRGQANFAEYVPLTLVLLGLLELEEAVPIVFLHASAVAFLVGRLLHAWAFLFERHWMLGRVGGTALTISIICVLAMANVLHGLGII